MTEANKTAIKAITAKIKDNPNANEDIARNCDSIDGKIDAEPTTDE
jgi:hypothetical protein